MSDNTSQDTGPAASGSSPGTDADIEARTEAATDADIEAIALDALRTVFDPELGLDVVSLGLVYAVRVTGDRVDVDMTLTTVGCPVAESLPAEAEEALRAALPDHEVEVIIVWDPPWSPERLSDDALEALGFRK